jgi:Flp pilus assembly protein TadG
MFVNEVLQRVGRVCLTRAVRSLRACRASVRSLLCRAFGPVLRDERGTALIEFALVVMPFLLLLIGTMEISLMFFTNAVIEGATKEAARQIRTGHIQESADPVVAFQDKLCDSLFGIIDCSKVAYNVQTFSSFGSVSMPLELDEDGEPVGTGFLPGGSSAVTVVRTMYRWKFFTPLISQMIPAGPGGHLLVSTVAFQNEPYNVN